MRFLFGAYPVDDGLMVDADLPCNASKSAPIEIQSHGETAESRVKSSGLGIKDVEAFAVLAVIPLFPCPGFTRFDLTITAPARGASESEVRRSFHNKKYTR